MYAACSSMLIALRVFHSCTNLYMEYMFMCCLYITMHIYICICIYIYRSRQKCQFAALHCIFSCSTHFLLQSSLLLQIWFIEPLYQENGCVLITYGTFQDPEGLSYPHKKYWTHPSIIQYYTITLNWVLTQRQVSYAMRDSKSYCTRKMAASQSRTVHSKTHRVCPVHTRNIGPIGPLSSTIPSPWIESLPKAGLICHARFKELMYQDNGCVPITYGTFQDPHGLSCPHKTYWTHRSIIQYYTITLNLVVSQRQVSYAMRDIKSYCTRKMAVFQSLTVHSKTHRVCPIHTRNIGPIGPLPSTKPSPSIESLPKGRSHMPCAIQRATVPGKRLRPNHVRLIPRPTGPVLSTQEILDSSVHYPVLYHHLELSPYPKAGLICHARFKELLYQKNDCVPISTVHSKTHRVCPIHTRNIGPIDPLSSTKPSPSIESLPKGRSHMPCAIQRATVPEKWLRPNHVRYIPRPTGSVLSTQEILDPSVHYPVLYHHLELSPYPKAGPICHARFKELLYQENGCFPITYGTFQDPQILSYPHKKYWTHRYIIQYYTITLNWVLTQRQVSYAMRDSKSYYTRKMAASQSRTVHSKTHRVCPIHTRNTGPIGPLSSTIPSPWIESLPKGRSHMPCAIQRAIVPGKWLRPNHVQYIQRPTGSVLSTQEILDPSVHYPVLYHHLESSPYHKAGLICHARFKELLYQENGCVPITYSTFQDPQGLSYPHKKYWTHRSIIQYYSITLNRVLTQRQVSYAMHDSKSYCTRKMAASQSRTVHSKTQRVCPIHTRNIGPIRPLSSTIPSPWIEFLPKGRSHMPCAIQRATVPGKWLHPNHVRYNPRPTGSVLSTQEILDPSVCYPVLYHHLESSPYPKAGLICHARFKERLYQENGCVPITYATFQDPQGLSYPHKKYWTNRSIIQYYTITLNHVLTKGRSHMPCAIQRATVPGKWLRPNHVRYNPRPTGSVLSTQEILDPSVHYPVLYHHLESSPYQRQVSYAMRDSKSYCTRKMAASQ